MGGETLARVHDGLQAKKTDTTSCFGYKTATASLCCRGKESKEGKDSGSVCLRVDLHKEIYGELKVLIVWTAGPLNQYCKQKEMHALTRRN